MFTIDRKKEKNIKQTKNNIFYLQRTKLETGEFLGDWLEKNTALSNKQALKWNNAASIKTVAIILKLLFGPLLPWSIFHFSWS